MCYWEEDEEYFEKSKVDNAYNEFLDKIKECIKQDIKNEIKNNDKTLEDAMKLKNEALEIKYELETKYANIDEQIEERAKQLIREWVKSFYDIDFKVGDKVFFINREYNRIKCPMCNGVGHINVNYKGQDLLVECPKCDKCYSFYSYSYVKDEILSIELGLTMNTNGKVIQEEHPNRSLDDNNVPFGAYEEDYRHIRLKNYNYTVTRDNIALSEEEAKEKIKLKMEEEKKELSKCYTKEEIEQIFKSVEQEND